MERTNRRKEIFLGVMERIHLLNFIKNMPQRHNFTLLREVPLQVFNYREVQSDHFSNDFNHLSVNIFLNSFKLIIIIYFLKNLTFTKYKCVPLENCPTQVHKEHCSFCKKLLLVDNSFLNTAPYCSHSTSYEIIRTTEIKIIKPFRL